MRPGQLTSLWQGQIFVSVYLDDLRHHGGTLPNQGTSPEGDGTRGQTVAFPDNYAKKEPGPSIAQTPETRNQRARTSTENSILNILIRVIRNCRARSDPPSASPLEAITAFPSSPSCLPSKPTAVSNSLCCCPCQSRIDTYLTLEAVPRFGCSCYRTHLPGGEFRGLVGAS